MKNLRILRKQHNLSQQELAEKLHVSQQSIYKYENAKSTPDITTLIAMSEYFNTSIDYLLDQTDIPHKIEPVTETSLNEQELIIIEYCRKLNPQNLDLITKLIIELSQIK